MPDRKRLLPPLSKRETRVQLLLDTYLLVAIRGRREQSESVAKDKPGSRLPSRPEEYYEGSYRALERALDALRRERRSAFYHLWRYHVDGVQTSGYTNVTYVVAGLKRLCELMPENIYVPQEFTVAAGYQPWEADKYSWKSKVMA